MNWQDKTSGGHPVKNIRNSKHYGEHLLEADVYYGSEWRQEIFWPNGKYAGVSVRLNDRSLDLVRS